MLMQHLSTTPLISPGRLANQRYRARQALYVLIVSLLVILLMPSIATAASFDCHNPTTRFEKTVCANPKLSAQDVVMTYRYEADLQLLSDQGKTFLGAGQQQWVKVVKLLCLDSSENANPAACMRRQYADRIDDLNNAVISLGPFVFSRVDNYTSIGKQEVTGRPLEQHTSLPRIDRPMSAIAVQWNAAIVRSAASARANWCFGDAQTPGDHFTSFKIQSATPDLINVEMLHTEQCAAGAPSQTMSNVSYVLKPALHRLRTEDLFKPDSGWERFLSNRASRVLNPDTFFADGINKGVRDPAAWSFTKAGLLISFNPGVADAIASGILEVTIPWTDLDRFFVPGAPIPRL
jgi:uncharacterized protein